MELFRLFGSIFVDNDKANSSIHKTEEKAESLGSKFVKGVGTAAKWGAAVAGAGVAALGSITALATKSSEATDRIDKMSQRLGMSRQAFQEWDFILSQNGVSIDSMQTGMKKMTQMVTEAQKGSKRAVESYRELDSSILTLIDSGASQEEIFKATVEAFQKMPDSVNKARLAQQMFGKQGQEMLPMLNQSKGSIDELAQKAHELGLVMGDETIDAGVKLGDTIDAVKKSFGAITTQIGAEVMPIVQGLLEMVLNNMPLIQSVVGVVFDVLGVAAGYLMSAIGFLSETFSGFFIGTTESATAFKGEFELFRTWFDGIFTLLGDIVKSMLEAIKGFWDTYGANIIAIAKTAFSIIADYIQYILSVIKGIIDIFTGLLTGDWDKVWEGVKGIVKAALEALKNIMPKLLQGVVDVIKGAAKLFLNAGKAIFEGLLEGIKFVWDSIVGFVQGAVDWLVDKLSFWKKSKDEMNTDDVPNPSDVPSNRPRSGGGALTIDGTHKTGLSYVPYDGYIAMLHKGEKVLTADEAQQSQRVEHVFSGTVVHKGVNDKGELAAVIETKVKDLLRREVLTR